MKTAILTGSEGQLGKIFVKQLKDLGYQVIGIDINEESQINLKKYIKTDLSRFESEFITNQLCTFKEIDLLINNAGVSIFSPFEKRTKEELDYVLDINLKAPILLSQLLFNKYFKSQKRGQIINIASIYGIISGDMRIYNEGDRRTPEIYGASKAGLINLTKYLAAYMAPFNVRVNSISPGGVFNNQDAEFVKKYSNKVPLNRMAKPSELKTSLAFLTSPDSSYLTGQNIIVDGGFTAW